VPVASGSRKPHVSQEVLLMGKSFAALTLLAGALAAEPRPDPAGPGDARAAADANNRFTLELYAQLRDQQGNLFVSPYSISTALAMTSAGARGATDEQMARVLHLRADPRARHDASAALIKRTLSDAGPGRPTLRVANKLFGAPGFGWRPEFLGLTASRYAAGPETADFPGNPQGARRTINDWVAGQTEQKIKDLLSPSDVTALTRLVLVNAIYFKGDWVTKFPKEETGPSDFRTAPGRTVTVSMMHLREKLRYAESVAWQALELPYQGGDLAMVVLLPPRADGVGDLEKRLTAEELAAALAGLHPEPVVVDLPKFKVTSRFELGSTLARMGMPDAFDPGKADFSGMADTKLAISRVIHQAYAEVDEAGTKAAAATAVVLPLPGPGGGGGPAPKYFRADHPFLTLIRDNRTGAILFLGRVAEPPPAELGRPEPGAAVPQPPR
jgi:serpin B